MTYYIQNSDGSIAYSSTTQGLLEKCYSGQTVLSTDENIVYGYDGKLYLESQKPADPDEKLYNEARAIVEQKYSAPWNGATGGILSMIQMTMTAALCEVPQDAAKIGEIGTQYQTELQNMHDELDAIDTQYGVA